MEDYYARPLTKEEQAAYHAMAQGLSAIAPSFPVPKLEMDRLSDLLFRLRLDHPELFYITGFSCRSYPQASSMEMVPRYLFDKAKVRTHQKALSARLDKLCREATGLDEWQKAEYVHDLMCRLVHYDKLKKPYSHEIIGPLTQGVGVCEGIAKSVKALCDRLGVWCIVAISHNAPDQGIRYRHAWNIVRLGGSYYHLDATFDNALSAGDLLRRDYLLLGDRQIFRDHQPPVYPLPPCPDETRAFYRREKLYFTRMEDVSRRALQAARKGVPLVFHWRGGYLTRAVLKELLELLDQAAREKRRYVQVRLNWPQAVLEAVFTSEPPGNTLVPQQANLGEELEAPLPPEDA